MSAQPLGNKVPEVGNERIKGEKMAELPLLREELESRVLARTGRRIRNLDIELSPEGVVLHGETTTFHVKQLAQHGVREILPDVRLQNAIKVGA